MSQLSRTAWEALYGTSGSEFPDNTTGLISELKMRTFGKNASDSIFFKNDDSYTAPFPFANAAGTDTYTATLSPAITAYGSGGLKVQIVFANANTGAATLNLNSLGAKPITKNGSTALSAGDISAGQALFLFYDGTQFQAQGVGGSGGGGTAAATTFTPAGTISATDVQAAIQELDTELYAKFRLTRTVTGTDSLVQGDDNSLIIFNSATPFNFTIDQLTVGSKFSWLNYGAGAVTLVNGTGVTIDGNTTAAARSGNIIATGLVDFSQSATVPKSIAGEPGGGGDRNAVAISAGTLDLDINNQREKNFDLTTTVSAAFAITFTNGGSWVRSRLTLRVTGARVVTLPSACIMDAFEVSNGRWNSSTNELTLTGITDSPFMIEFVPDSSSNVWVFATNNGV